MAWFDKWKSGLGGDRNQVPDGVWIKCQGLGIDSDRGCGQSLYRRDLEQNQFVCPICTYHHRMPIEGYFALLLDDGEFEEVAAGVASADPLNFQSTKSYIDQIAADQEKTGRLCAFVGGTGRINGRPVALGCLDYSFRGGSLGSAEGEKISRLIHTAISLRLPVVIISASGGARMQESALSLMQMAKTSAKLAQLSEAQLPYFSVMTSPTTGGVTASFAMLGDVNIAEPQATIGFAGDRVRQETIKEDLPEGFQRAEFLLEHGFVDRVVDRNHLKGELSRLIELLTLHPPIADQTISPE